MSEGLKFGKNHPYEVIVCGAGHAGCEAALASARMGVDTLILSGNVDTIAAMSCNPAIGGQAKGQIVGEIDALGGEMGVNADVTAIQFRELNTRKGPAVRSRRAQCDKKAYQFRMKHTLELQPHLTVFQAMVTGLIFEGDKVVGVRTNHEIEFYAKAVVVTTGTFLRAQMHIGSNKTEGGRLGDFSAKTLSNSFTEAGIELERLKTGTPPRILGSSIDLSQCDEQPGDEKPAFFAFYDTILNAEPMFHVEHGEIGFKPEDYEPLFAVNMPGQRKTGWVPGMNQLSCWATRTTDATEKLVRNNLKRSALYCGEIVGSGPRYCPSIEDKFVKFADKDTHRIYLEPEGLHTDEWYINGLSTSLPFDIQQDMIRSIVGLEQAVMLRPAYAVEYDFAPPTQLFPSLMSKKVENLFFAGQINGTSGYEEAAGQGLVAGINAAQKVRGGEALTLARNEAYIGVLIDDLVTKGTQEPYRMFTSRAEHRMLFNHGSAEMRLVHHAEKFNLLPPARLKRVKAKQARVLDWMQRMEKERHEGDTWAEHLRRTKLGESCPLPEDVQKMHPNEREELLYRVKYKGYLERETRAVEKMKKTEKVRLPEDIDYQKIPSLRIESGQKLAEIRPATLGQAARISGVSPADIQLLLVYLESRLGQKTSE